MSVSIRLAKFGKRHAPTYRVVVSETRNKRNGKFIDTLGTYNPADQEQGFKIDKKLYESWIAKGAIVSNAVKMLVDGTYEYVKYSPKKTGAEDDKKTSKEDKKEAPTEAAEMESQEEPKDKEKQEAPQQESGEGS
jgi:small subunit ribosomal protein S16